MLSGTGQHSYEVDWWALGITMSELLIGHSPFCKSSAENPTEKVAGRRILCNKPDLSELRINHNNADSPVECFIRALLVKDPAKRLGNSTHAFHVSRSVI